MFKTTTALFGRSKLAPPVLLLFLILFGYNNPGAYAQCHANFYYTFSQDTVTFHDTSTAAGGYGITYSFGDGNYSYLSPKKTVHVYTGADSTYKVCISIIDSVHHCNDDTCIYIKIKPVKCHASFSYATTGRQVTFYNHSRASHSGAKYTWSFGDGTSSHDQNISHTYSSNGTYTVCVTIYDSLSYCSDKYCESLVISGSACKADYTYKFNSNREIKFTSTSYSPHYRTYLWSFGDSSTSTDSTPVHNFTKIDSSYSVCLTIIDPVEKCTTKVCKTFHMAPYYCIPNFDYTLDGKKVTFVNNSTSTFHYTSSWTFGDGSTSHDKSPNHTYSKDSAFTVCLTIVDSNANCTHTLCKIIDFNNTYTIYGSIYPDSSHHRKGKVWLIKYDPSDSSLHSLKDTIMDSTNNHCMYYFKHVKPGIYYTKAAYDSTNPLDTLYIPSYHNDAVQWNNAIKIEVNHADVYAGIQMKAGAHSNSGKGFISGKISAGANKVGDPLPGQEVILYSQFNLPLSHTKTDANGTFMFAHLAMGTYIVHVEVLGINSQPALVTLSDKNASVSNIDFTVSATKVRSLSSVIGTQASQENINVYPNPVRNDLMININTVHAQDALVLVYDINGRLVSQNNMRVSPGDQVLHLNTSGFKNGMYFIKVQLSHDNYIIQSPFVKSE